MSDPEVPKPRLWPRAAVGPLGNRAMFDCPGDVPVKWKLEIPLPSVGPFETETFTASGEFTPPPKGTPGRPPKAKP